MTKETEEVLKLTVSELPENFVPTNPLYIEKSDNFPETIMYWVVGKDGKEKTYLQATPREILNWGKSIFPKEIPSKYRALLNEFNEENLVLENYKAYYIGTLLKAIEESGIYSLFGKQKDWDKIENWVRQQKGKNKTSEEKE